MYISNFRHTVIIASICYFVIGCGGKKKSLGMDDEIRVVCSEIDEPLLRNYLSTIFNDTLYAPQPEPIFKIIFSRPESYQDLKKYSQIIVAAVNRNNSNSGYRLLQKLLSDKQLKNSIDDNPMLLTRDLYAKDQVFVILNASNEQHLFYELEKNKKLLRMHYDEQFKIRGNKFIFEDNQIEIEKKLSQSYKWSIKVPWGWEVLRDNIKTNFFWMGSEYPYKWISVKWDNGNYIEDEYVYVGTDEATANTTAKVISWNTADSVLKITDVVGTFSATSNVVGNTSGAYYSLQTTPNTQEFINDSSANNVGFETEADSIIDFSETNPFSEANP